jgi:hypothetical protein
MKKHLGTYNCKENIPTFSVYGTGREEKEETKSFCRLKMYFLTSNLETEYKKSARRGFFSPNLFFNFIFLGLLIWVIMLLLMLKVTILYKLLAHISATSLSTISRVEMFISGFPRFKFC